MAKDLYNAGYYNALRTLIFSYAQHRGYRKDGITPSFRHQFRICRSLFDDSEVIINAGINPDNLIGGGAAHDLFEDHPELLPWAMEELVEKTATGITQRQYKINTSVTEIALRLDKNRIGEFVDDPRFNLTLDKIFKKDKTFNHLFQHGITNFSFSKYLKYLSQLIDDPPSFIVKLRDREDNMHFIRYLDPQKQAEYLWETKFILAVVDTFVTLYPEKEYPGLGVMVQKSRRQIRDAYRDYLGNLQEWTNDLFKTLEDFYPPSKTSLTIMALTEAGFIKCAALTKAGFTNCSAFTQGSYIDFANVPRPSCWSGPLLRPGVL